MKLWFAKFVMMVLDPIYWWAYDIDARDYERRFGKYYDSELDQ
jgi:hypothetical protein